MTLESLLEARPTHRTDLGDWYAQILAIAERDGIRIPELAERLGCARETVYSWRRRLTKKTRAPFRPAVGLVRVQVAESAHESETQRFEVRTRNGRSVFVPNRFDPSTLAAVVTALERC